MPCNFGVQSSARMVLPEPQTIRGSIDAPEFDAELLELIGMNDPGMLDWLQSLEVRPLLEEALRRALARNWLEAAVKLRLGADGRLSGTVDYTGSGTAAEAALQSAFNLWQMEVLGIVAELLGYTATMTRQAGGGYCLIGLRPQPGMAEPAFLRITTSDKRGGELAFEHFASVEAVRLEEAKFLSLAAKLGIKLTLRNRVIRGKPVTTEETEAQNQREAEGGQHEH